MRPRSQQTTTEEHCPPSPSGPADGRPVLLVAFPTRAGLPITGRGELVGRGRLAEAGVHDTKISSRHLRLSIDDGRAHVEDQGSRNGTWIDGVRAPVGKPVALHDGAVLRIGRTLLVHRACFSGDLVPAEPLGRLVGPWGLGEVRARLRALAERRRRDPAAPPPNVLIEGETGTGKELVAAAVIKALDRTKSFASINVAAVAAGVFEAQLFGWVKGAYSGSASGGDGVLRGNEGGAVFLDEIGELPAELQPKLLRVLENREVQPVGAARPVRVDVAILAATNRPLENAVERGAFRRDLHARFTERISLPPLSDRPEDLFAILEALAARYKAPIDPEATEVEAVERLMLEAWPANIRDLDRVARALARPEPLTLALTERLLGPRRSPTHLTRDDAERMVLACGGSEREVERRFGVSRGKLRRALGKAGRGS